MFILYTNCCLQSFWISSRSWRTASCIPSFWSWTSLLCIRHLSSIICMFIVFSFHFPPSFPFFPLIHPPLRPPGTCLLLHLFSSYLTWPKVSVYWPSQSGKDMNLTRLNGLHALEFYLSCSVCSNSCEGRSLSCWDWFVFDSMTTIQCTPITSTVE